MLFLLGLTTSCFSPQYVGEVEGQPVIIKDSNDIIKDAIEMGIDSITIVKFSRQVYWEVETRHYDDDVRYWSDTLADGRAIAGSIRYRNISLSKIKKR